MTNEKEIKKYLSSCDKEALISLYLQMRFERDLWQMKSRLRRTKMNKKLELLEWFGNVCCWDCQWVVGSEDCEQTQCREYYKAIAELILGKENENE